MSPVVTVMAAPTFTFCPAINVRFPVVIVVAAVTFTSRTVLNVRFPVVVFVAAFTFTSRPAFATKLPLVPVIAAPTITSRTASNVRVVAAVQVTGTVTVISPDPLPPAFAELIVTPVVSSAVVMSLTATLAVLAPEPGEKTLGLPPLNDGSDAAPVIVTSAGSSSHVPFLPLGALALTLMPDTSSQ